MRRWAIDRPAGKIAHLVLVPDWKGRQTMPANLVKIFGERNTGTNLLRQIIERNSSCALWPGTIKELGPTFQAEVLERLSDAGLTGRDAIMLREFLQDEIIIRSFDLCLGWKHAAPSVHRIAANTKFQDTHFIVITKNPYAWLLSFHSIPYHNLLTDNARSFTAFIRTPWLTTRRDNAPGIFGNPIELYNYKHLAYAKLAQAAPVTLVRYEDLLEDPTVIFSASGLQSIPGRSLDVPRESVKGGQQTFESYQEMYRQRFWTTRIENNDRDFINRSLDPQVLEYLNYQTF
jgi:hypothetical protein